MVSGRNIDQGSVRGKTRAVVAITETPMILACGLFNNFNARHTSEAPSR